MECGKLTAKLRDAVPVCFMVNDHEVKRYKNIEIPEEIKHLEYSGFRFDVPETWPATRERQHRAPKASRSENMELQFGVKGADRKTLVAVISTITGIDAEFLGVPSLAYKIGDYAVDKDGTVTGPASKELVEALEAKGFTSKNEEGENDHE